MMVPKRSLLLAGTALLCFGTVAEAQKTHTMKTRRVTKPLINATLDLQTGMYTIGSAVNEKGAPLFNTEISLDNLDFSGFVGIDSQTCEWYTSANKGTGNTGGKSEVMTSFLFAYCSSALATVSGGVGGSAIIEFRSGYAGPTGGVGSGPGGANVATFNISGMPANTNSSSFFGGFNCFLLRVRSATPMPIPIRSFSGGQVMPDGPLGWSWNFSDLATDGTLAHTFPFLSCVQSCSGVGPDNTGGMTDYVDQYCPTGSLLSTFTFGTATTFTSANIQLREAEALAGQTTTYNGTGFNPPNSLINISDNGGGPGAAPILDGRWKLMFNCTGASLGGNPSKLVLIQVSFLFFGPPPPPSMNSRGEILVSLSPPGKTFFTTHTGGTGTFPPGGPGILIPVDLGFYNACYAVQALCGGAAGTAFLTSGLIETVGSF